MNAIIFLLNNKIIKIFFIIIILSKNSIKASESVLKKMDKKQGTYLQKCSILLKVGSLQKIHNFVIFPKIPDL